jgi:hypothetical protein
VACDVQGNSSLMTVDTGGMTNAMAYQRFKRDTREPDGMAQSWASDRGGLWIDNKISQVLLRAYERKVGRPPTEKEKQEALLASRQLKEEKFQFNAVRGIPTLGEIRMGPQPGLSIVLAARHPDGLPDHIKSM